MHIRSSQIKITYMFYTGIAEIKQLYLMNILIILSRRLKLGFLQENDSESAKKYLQPIIYNVIDFSKYCTNQGKSLKIKYTFITVVWSPKISCCSSFKGTGTRDLIWLKVVGIIGQILVSRAYGRPLKNFKVLLYIFN